MKKQKLIYGVTFLIVSLCALFMTHTARSETEPHKIVVGAYINDIQAIDLQNHSYVVDLYLWFRWSPDAEGALNPAETFEFMNAFDPEGHVGTLFYDEPVPQPDGTVYNLIRHQGAFSSKFDVSKYPFDHQRLRVVIEDAEMGADEFIYIPDDTPITVNPDLKLPGYTIGSAHFDIQSKPYSTAFGDLSEPDIFAYSRGTIILKIDRPIISGAIKLFLPLLLVVLSAVFALLLDPAHVEARVGLAITALLALVALQFSAVGGLPEVGYLLLLDKMYLASYVFTLSIVFLVTYASRVDEQGALQGKAGALKKIAESGPIVSIVMVGVYVFSIGLILVLDLFVFP